jgi:hypothetical protein
MFCLLWLQVARVLAKAGTVRATTNSLHVLVHGKSPPHTAYGEGALEHKTVPAAGWLDTKGEPRHIVSAARASLSHRHESHSFVLHIIPFITVVSVHSRR